MKNNSPLSSKFHFGEELLELYVGDRYYIEEDIKQFIGNILKAIDERNHSKGLMKNVDEFNDLLVLKTYIKQEAGAELLK